MEMKLPTDEGLFSSEGRSRDGASTWTKDTAPTAKSCLLITLAHQLHAFGSYRSRRISRCLTICVSEQRCILENSWSLNSSSRFACRLKADRYLKRILELLLSAATVLVSKAASHPEAALEALADHVEGDWIDAGVHGRHVDADVVQHQEETRKERQDQPSSGTCPGGCCVAGRFGRALPYLSSSQRFGSFSS